MSERVSLEQYRIIYWINVDGRWVDEPRWLTVASLAEAEAQARAGFAAAWRKGASAYEIFDRAGKSVAVGSCD